MSPYRAWLDPGRRDPGRAAPFGRAAERDACGTGFVADAEGRASRSLVDAAIDALCRMRHRGAVAADARTGDGAGLLLPIPRRLLAEELAASAGGPAPEPERPGVPPERLGIAMVFVFEPDDHESRRIVEAACAQEGIEVLRWRRVPVDPAALGARALDTMPLIVQAVLARPRRSAGHPDRPAFRARRRAEQHARRSGVRLCFPSFSFLTVTYKALVAADQLARFYRDLRDPRLEASFAVFHQRYSTNTAPTWERAQPFRLLCHNGEINTIAGNVNAMRAREGSLGAGSPRDEELLRPVIDEEGSDSSMLDEAVELLTREGQVAGGPRDVRHAVAMLVPAAWERSPDMDPDLRGFYRYHACLVEPWDGPAALVFTDGIGVGAALDRNGLRPLRYAVCDDGFVACASEAGAVDTRGHGSVRRGKLGPGQMIFVDPREGGFQQDPIQRIARRRPYGRWAAEHLVRGPSERPAVVVPPDLLQRQVLHGYSREELALVIRPAATEGKEPTFSMGDDTPIPPLNLQPRPLFAHLRQRFAQVTNPAIDHLRERHVMSLRTLLGGRDPLLWERPRAAALIEHDTFLLLDPPAGLRLDASWPVSEGPAGLRSSLERLRDRAVRAARAGRGILVVTAERAGPERAPVPSLLAVGAVDGALRERGLRTRASIVAQADDARESHHFACLLGFGADAVHPGLALASVAALAGDGRLGEGDPSGDALLRYRSAIEDGVLKILAKLGICSLDPYRGARAFDVLGLAQEVADLCLGGIPSPLGGLGLEDIARDVLARHAQAYEEPAPRMSNPGSVKYHRGGEYHATNPNVVRALHLVVDPALERLRSTAAAGATDEAEGDEEDPADRRGGEGTDPSGQIAQALHRAVREPGDPEAYARFADLVASRPPSEPRDLLELVPAGPPIPLDEVEPAAAIARRFSTGAISHGAISKEAHETLAIALNRLGGKANTGEGGEDPDRYRTERNCAIKQVASGRFGVTPEYCSFARELQIKIAQGSKPGEGGQLPGHKVTEEIARLRHTQPGVALISPAPHHDIYSIEDLSQLIFDLKQVNPDADVSVKLVSELGVGTIAAGVAKGLAEVVHIAGADGGTGASPLSSIKHAGLPWEIGLAETQQVLAGSGLRGRVRIRVDGGLKTGRDVVVAALLGADEYSFGTAALLAQGCIMVRTCHLDTCPVGIATQRPELRARFAGTPEMVVAYLTSVAEEVRRILSSLGLRSLDEAIGRTDLLRQRTPGGRADTVDLTPLLRPAPGKRRFEASLPLQRQRSELGDRLFDDAWPVLRAGGIVDLEYRITNEDRTVGARLGGAIGHDFGSSHPPGLARVTFRGTAGQSFGAFLAAGVDLRLIGEANDYVGKGMSGGRIAIVPPEDDAGDPWLVGNAVLYGATGGVVFIAGRAGERFAVRNSGATAVVEGIGEHGCEYMTGGTVVVLGPVGQNLGAGMTGGVVYVYDPLGQAAPRVNPELVDTRAPDEADAAELKALVERHLRLTGSRTAADVLGAWDEAVARFLRVSPRADVDVITRRNEGTKRLARV